MVGMFGQKVSLGQANGPDVELIVSGNEDYANYETPDGFPAIYDESRGLFCYARLVAGRFESTGIPVTEPPPPGVTLHGTESDEVRQKKIQERTLQKERRSRNPKKGVKR
jgi:hypothetical protein